MSPSEADLRAALRHGEDDDGLDVDGVIAHVRGRRAQRRTRVLSSAAAVVVVAGAAIGGAALWGGSDDHETHRGGPAAPVPTTSTTSAAGTRAGPSIVRPTCPRSASRPVDPPGLTPKTAPEQAMFPAPVQTLLACSYTDAAAPRQATVTGSAATALAATIEAASPTKARIMCPDITTGRTTLLVLVPVTADGTVLPALTTDVSLPDCNRPITNGTAVRYNWRPPQSLTAQLAAAR